MQALTQIQPPDYILTHEETGFIVEKVDDNNYIVKYKVGSFVSDEFVRVRTFAGPTPKSSIYNFTNCDLSAGEIETLLEYFKKLP